MTVNLLTQVLFVVTSDTKLIAGVPLQLSVADAAAVLTAGIADAQVTVVAAGQVMVGATLSSTVMFWLQVAVLPHASVAIYVRVTVNLLTQVLFVVTSDTKLIAGVPLQLSVADAFAVFTAGMAEAQATVVAAGQVMVGATLSSTVMI